MKQPRVRQPVEDDIRQSFGRAVRELRDQASLSQEALAALSELSVSYISLLERGRKTATLFSAARIGYVFGMSLPQLLAYADSQEHSE
jgi:transcriptional regulator with XRE-family HTH domain